MEFLADVHSWLYNVIIINPTSGNIPAKPDVIKSHEDFLSQSRRKKLLHGKYEVSVGTVETCKIIEKNNKLPVQSQLWMKSCSLGFVGKILFRMFHSCWLLFFARILSTENFTTSNGTPSWPPSFKRFQSSCKSCGFPGTPVFSLRESWQSCVGNASAVNKWIRIRRRYSTGAGCSKGA